MRDEDRVIFLAARQNFSDGHKEKIRQIAKSKGIRWDLLFQAAGENGISALIYKNITEVPDIISQLSQSVLEQNQQIILSNLAVKKKRAAHIMKALEVFDQKNWRAILLKGAALDLVVYAQPWYTRSKDVDIMINARLSDISPRELRRIQTIFYMTGVEYDFYEHHDMNMNGMLPINFDTVWQNAQPIPFGRSQVWLLSPEDFLLSLCVNSCRKRFFRLKSLLDIAETIAHFQNLNWDTFARRCIEYGCANIAYSAIEVTRRTLGCQAPLELCKPLGLSAIHKAGIDLTISLLLKGTSLTFPYSKFNFLNRWADVSLILPYVTYHPGQVSYILRNLVKNQAGKNPG